MAKAPLLSIQIVEMRFPWQKKESSEPSPAATTLQEAEKLARDGQLEEALGALIPGFHQDSGHRPLYQFAERVLRQLNATEEAALFAVAQKNLNAAEPLYNLGYHFIEVGRTSMAFPFLKRANQLEPQNPRIASELAVASCEQFAPQLGYEALVRAQPVEFWECFQMHWCGVLAQRGLDDALAFAHDAQSELNSPDLDEETYALTIPAIEKLSTVLERLATVENPAPHIRDWQLIQHGGAVLKPFDRCFSDEDVQVAGGRWVYVQLNASMIVGILQNLRRFLKEVGRAPKLILVLPDRDSEIVGRAAAQVMGLPWEFANEELLGAPYTLIVSASTRALNDWEALETTATDQTVFALDLPFLERARYSPDVVGVLSQLCVLPWAGGGFRVDPETQAVVDIPADERLPQEIAAELAATESEEDSNFDEHLAFYKRYARLLIGHKYGQTRTPFLIDSPLPAARFGS